MKTKSFHLSDFGAHTGGTSKRPRGEGASDVGAMNDEHRGGPQKRVKGVSADGVLGEAASTNEGHREPSTGTPVESVNHRSEAAGRGAGLQVAPINAHESTEVAAQENLPRGGTDEGARGVLYMIPNRLNERHKALLKATPDERQVRTIRELKCRLCPDSAFSGWEGFKKHCNTVDAHPHKIFFCTKCGDFFACRSALNCHCEKPPKECLSVTPEKAQEKQRETKRVHADFQEKLRRCLRTGEALEHFAQTIKNKFPDSSKHPSNE
jgi:hypothetical protein